MGKRVSVVLITLIMAFMLVININLVNSEKKINVLSLSKLELISQAQAEVIYEPIACSYFCVSSTLDCYLGPTIGGDIIKCPGMTRN